MKRKFVKKGHNADKFSSDAGAKTPTSINSVSSDGMSGINQNIRVSRLLEEQ